MIGFGEAGWGWVAEKGFLTRKRRRMSDGRTVRPFGPVEAKRWVCPAKQVMVIQTDGPWK